ncbi:transcriptional regulator [Bacillus sp. AFS002410]|uniref:helix-turn-helix domain-containing protein n=1 Tax=Bacillus sp. AFS002410 TaxID=2033481 RepID=UPI000BEFDDE6|nr:helix-turn-helix domain-containing protein [Bacillus sp. AFS002410]PEJ60558.1 transcriptional regulator [Bacillus sp. AFS002410]
MLVGEIIKYYREKKGISQSKLGEGICGKAYISRFESGKVTLSPEIIYKLANKLEIDINKEIESLYLIEKHLNDWNQAIIMQRTTQIEGIKLELEQNPFIMASKHAANYMLLTGRYYLHKNMFKEAKSIIENVEKEFPTLSNYEKNLLLHIKGMYCISTFRTIECEECQTAVKLLKQINLAEYNNEEYYYHLAFAYHHANAKVSAFTYAEKALQFFNKTYNHVNAMNAQILMLMQFDSERDIDFLELVENYKNLIHNCVILGAQESKINILYNLGEEFYKKGKYDQAVSYFEEAFLLTDKSSIKYLRRLYHFTEACLDGKLLKKENILEKIDAGTKLAKKQCQIYFNLYKLLGLKCKKNLSQYYQFLAEVVVPQIIATNNTSFFEQYGKILYNHHVEQKEYEKAIEVDKSFKLMHQVLN